MFKRVFGLTIVASLALAGMADAAPTCANPGIALPLRVAPAGRHLVDADGQPFFMHGDTAWSLIADLTSDEAEFYLQDRKSRGFNTILVNLLEAQFATRSPANIAGDLPFVDGNYAMPNEAYFSHADAILQRACELGFVVLLAPSYVGNQGGSEGWYQTMEKNGAERMRTYGRFLGERYADLPNIVWVEAGDYDPPDKDLVRALAEGIAEKDPDALQTAHGSPGSPALHHWRGEPWLAINNVYTYDPVYVSAAAQYRASAMPFFLMESAYEDEHGAGAYRTRMQAYQAILSGAFGHVFGNNPIWHFGGPGLFRATAGWEKALDSPGTRSMQVLKDIFETRKWALLEPDAEDALLIGGRGDEAAHAVAALADDRSFALVYMPTPRRMTLDLSRLAGPRVAAHWLDPSTGDRVAADGGPFPSGPTAFVPPPANRAGDPDWILELTSEMQSQ